MLDEGFKVFTNMHMNWDGIQGIELFELTSERNSAYFSHSPLLRALT
jgi:hypothetical protein